jgi:hypothetical protein
MPVEFTEDDNAALIDLLRSTIATDPFPLSPRIRKLRAILAKLDPGPSRPTALPAAPNPRSRQGAVLAKKRRR